MAFRSLVPPRDLPTHVLFPEHYAASKRMVARDLLVLGGIILGSVLFLAHLGRGLGV